MNNDATIITKDRERAPQDLAPLNACEQVDALSRLSALSQPTRLEAFRILARAGQTGMRAGELARELATRHNTLSTHLAILQNAGLIRSERGGRNVTYFIEPGGLEALLLFLDQTCRKMIPACEQPEGVSRARENCSEEAQ
ncbi:DNA-binding transcriptional regulator, ArsR family [Cohaesibacter sp. ES.047]|uniref:ArsR/SmtB family transcription factor n=1 Tax=Cohaesibacter sp. ES.047 TaxID=1798205 RepID=UPI000BB8358D|nr:metalloregulator ArsR/SmtB family transcription factor [Cohaesibacter sp. ES.047]SNY92445.1 DNA-binding transcriptional regulator, ArsR family [Cohaesibacter sp. ES.047]